MTNTIESSLVSADSTANGTNNLASTIAPSNPPDPPPPPSGVSWTMPATVIAVVGLGLLAAKKLKASSAAFEKSAKEELVDDVLDAVAKDAPDRAALREELAAAVAGSGILRTDSLRSILRIEESYEKLPSGKYLRRVSVLRKKEGTTGTGSLTKIENERGWEYVPADIRDRFVETRDNKVVRLVYDAEGNHPA